MGGVVVDCDVDVGSDLQWCFGKVDGLVQYVEQVFGQVVNGGWLFDMFVEYDEFIVGQLGYCIVWFDLFYQVLGYCG